jgi:hypothetical protein
MSNDYVFDIETYPNVFTLAVEHAEAPLRWAFEITPWRNDSKEIIAFLQYLKDTNARLVGFNNLGFDYPVLHTLIRMGHSDAFTLYQKAMAIINSQDDSDRWMHMVNPSDRFVEQVDLFKIHHFDNKARATSLKVLEFNMRSDNIEDLPFKVGTELTQEQAVKLKQYNAHDVAQTKLFLGHTADMIKFREELCRLYPGKDWINYNDTKIGKEFFAMKLEEAGVTLYDFGPKGRTPRQTPRPQLALKDAVLPWITFEQPEFTRVLGWLKDQVITETKGVFDDVVARVDGFEFVFGLGGIHGSVESEVIESDADHVIVDLDVSSYYPNLAISNRFYPAHLGESFCDIYKHLYEQRKTYAKNSAENAMLKLALNGVYGDSNNPFSVFYDPLFTMSITLNGQLLLCVLAEGMMHIDGLKIIQVNTDGMTVRVPRANKWLVDTARAAWESRTGLRLEEAIYSHMFIRDVNNYIARYEDGKVKRKGAYEYKMGWHQNAGGLVVPKVAEKVLIDGAPIRETVEQWPHIMDFMLRTKVPRSSYLAIEHDSVASQLQNVTRYYIAKDGGHLFKWMPPLKAKPGVWRKIGVESGWGVQPCNDINDAGKLPVDFDYYIREVEKLCLGLA